MNRRISGINSGQIRTLNSNQVLEKKLNNLSTSTDHLFQGREIDVKTENKINDLPLIKSDKQYLLDKLINLFSPEDISSENTEKLRKLIKDTDTFKIIKTRSIEQITRDDLLRLRLEIQRNPEFINNATEEELEEIPQDKQIEYYKQKLHSQNLIEQQHALYKLSNIYIKNDDPINYIECCGLILSIPEQSEYQHIAHQQLADLARHFEQVLNFESVPSIDQQNIISMLASVYMKQGNTMKAFEYYGRILRIPEQSPYQEIAKQQLEQGAIYYEHLLNSENLSLIDQQSILHTLSCIYIAQDNGTKAIECYGQILRISEPSPFQEIARQQLDNSISHLKQKLDTESLSLTNQQCLLYSLADLYMKREDVSKALECYEQILTIPEASCYQDAALQQLDNLITHYEKILNLETTITEKKENALFMLANICTKQGNTTKAIEYCEQRLAIPDLSLTDQQDALFRLVFIYQKQKMRENVRKCCERIIAIPKASWYQKTALQTLAPIYIGRGDRSSASQCLERILTFDDITLTEKQDALQQLADIYKKLMDTEKLTETYERILQLEGISIQAQRDILNALLEIYQTEGNKEKMIKCYEQMLCLSETSLKEQKRIYKALTSIYNENGENITEIQLLKKHYLTPILQLNYKTDADLIQKILTLFDQKPDARAADIITILSQHPKLWQGENKLTLNQWTTLINSETSEKFINTLYENLITISGGLNKKLLINDPTMPEWNVLSQKEEDIDDEVFQIIQTVVADLFDFVNTENETSKEHAIKFFNQCMNTADAQTDAGRQHIRKRLAATVDYLQGLKAIHNQSTDEREKALIQQHIKNALKIMATGGSACPDRATVYLIHLENAIKLFANPKYLPNILVQMFKHEAVKDYLVDPRQAESIETCLFLYILMNSVLGLGHPKGGRMLYPDVAKKMSLEEALKKLSPALTLDNLLNFIAHEEIFQLAYDAEMKQDPSVQEAEYNFSEADGDYDYARIPKQPKAERDRLKTIIDESENNLSIAKEEYENARISQKPQKELDQLKSIINKAESNLFIAKKNYNDAVAPKESQQEINRLKNILNEAELALNSAKENFFKDKARTLLQESGFIVSS